MDKINCEVTNCSHNNSGICYSKRVDIGGKSAIKDCDTCCGSFLDELLYSDLTSSKNSDGQCDCLICNVTSCTHNSNSVCNLDSINVSGQNAKLYSETNCSSFDLK